MKIFTYREYIKCIHTFRLNAVMQLAEESVEYQLEGSNKKDTKEGEEIKKILQNKEEVSELINQFLEPREKIKKEELMSYQNSYIIRKHQSKEVSFIYKLRRQEIFFLIEHQSSINSHISYQLLNYCLDIMQEWGKNKKTHKIVRYPIIVPIIIYTGSQKWKIEKKEKDIDKRYKMQIDYNLIDINKISKQTLLEKNTMFGYTMFLEKVKNKKERMQNMDYLKDKKE